MPVTDIQKDPEALTMTVTAEFAADPARVWRLYSERDQIQRWWGPPGWPATFLRHELVPGGGSHYFMEGPDESRSYGVWSVVETDPPRSFVIEDGFSDETGAVNAELGTSRMDISFAPGGSGTIVTAVTTFASAEQLQQMLDMGMEEGLRGAMDQIDGILAEEAA